MEARNVPKGRLFFRRDLIDGERRIVFFIRGDDAQETDAYVKRTDLWVRAKGLGFMQYHEGGHLRSRVRVGANAGSQYIGKQTPVYMFRPS